MLISLSALAHDIQHVRAAQEPGTVAAERARQQPALTVISRAAPSGRRRGLIRTYVMFAAFIGGLTCGNVRFRGRVFWLRDPDGDRRSEQVERACLDRCRDFQL